MFECFNYEINEIDGVLYVVVFRRGFLGDVLFVCIFVIGLIVISGEDFFFIGFIYV